MTPTTPLTLPCPAKINLFLHITGRRDDGYHELQTLFQLLEYGDELTLTRRDDSAIRLTDAPAALAGDDNLVLRAARALQAHTGVAAGADLALNKRLPVGGGVGGGSSDAATTLIGLNRLWNTRLGLRELAEIGAELGADVPVFVHGETAWAEGIGEQLTPLDTTAGWYLVIHPGVFVSTAEVFAAPELTRQHAPIKMAAFFSGQAQNDCEIVVKNRHPEIANALNWLNNFSAARLTGTGACVFARFEVESDARAVLSQLPAGMTGFVAAATQRSPLHRCLELPREL